MRLNKKKFLLFVCSFFIILSKYSFSYHEHAFSKNSNFQNNNFTKVFSIWEPQSNEVKYQENLNVNNSNKMFNMYFDKVKVLSLDKDVIIANVSSLDVDKSGNLLITDNIERKVFLFNRRGKLLKELNPDYCHPGFKWNPVYAKFNKSGEILVINSLPWGFKFKNDGNCLVDMDLTFMAPSNLCFKTNGDIVGFYNSGFLGDFLCDMNSFGKEKYKFGKFPSDFRNILNRIEGGGIITDDNDNIYQLTTVSPQVFKYNSSGKFINEFEKIPSNYRRITQDIGKYSGNVQKLFEEMKSVMENNTLSYCLFLLDRNKIMVELITKKKYTVQVFDLNGNYLLGNNEITIDVPFIYAGDGFGYIVNQPPPDKNGNLSNPIINIYRFNK